MVDVPSWAELLTLMALGPADEPTVRGAIRHTGPGEGWVAVGSRSVIAGLRPGVDDEEPPPLRVWRHGRRVRLEEPDGQVDMIVGDDRIWQYDAERGVHVESERVEVLYVASGTQLLERRPLSEYAGTDFTRPAGAIGATTFLGRPAWTVEVAPPPHKPHPLQLVVDAETGIVLQQRNDGLGSVEEWVEFVVGEEFDPGLFTWTGPVIGVAELQAQQEARHEADMAGRRAWFRSAVTGAALRLEFEVEPFVHVFAPDGSFEASLGAYGGYGGLARRPRSDEPWDLHWHRVDRRWSTERWDWAVRFDDAQPTEDSLRALIEALSGEQPLGDMG